jgi:hypothetical protein
MALTLQNFCQALQEDKAALEQVVAALQQQMQAAPSAETVAALEQENAALLEEKAALDELVKAAPSAEAMAAHILKRPLQSNKIDVISSKKLVNWSHVNGLKI